MFKRSLKIIAILVLVAFTFTYALPTQQMALAASIENIKNTKANISYEKPTVNTQLGNFAKDISEYVAKLR
jgi:pyridoxine/pyridoxamine 5'-phosphate oxidase